MTIGVVPEENYLKDDVRHYKTLELKMANLLMQLTAGEDVQDKANNLVKKNFPTIYKKYE